MLARGFDLDGTVDNDTLQGGSSDVNLFRRGGRASLHDIEAANDARYEFERRAA